MPRTLLVIGTRKGCFVLESDADRRDWKLRGPYCEGWPVYHAIHDPSSGTIYAAAASEWHGSAVWRTTDAGSTWARADNGLPQEDAHLGVLREGMVADTYDVPGYYFGTSTGQIFASNDDAASWREIASYLPAISSVEVAILD